MSRIEDRTARREGAGQGPPRRLRLLSFNIHAATSTDRFHHYLTHSWRQVLPHSQRVRNLDEISSLVTGFDMVALQEADTGSLRSGFLNQSRYIATHAGMPYWVHQSTRKLGNMSFTGNGFLSRFEPLRVEEHRLPGVIPGRGSMLLHFGGERGLVVAVVHLALGRRARELQLDYLAGHLHGAPNLVVMGDFNTEADGGQVQRFCERLGLRAPTAGIASYPAWQPQRSIDHILVSEALATHDIRALEVAVSDHCPVALTLELPVDIDLAPRAALLSAAV
ncbi:MAG: endonuclease/exonuclease/phosphatase family protein [Gammaproteobacteria bacterium]